MCLIRAESSSFSPLPQGTVGFEQHVDKCLELSAYLYHKIKNRAGFEMVFHGEVRSSEYCYHLMKRCGAAPAFLCRKSTLEIFFSGLMGAFCFADKFTRKEITCDSFYQHSLQMLFPFSLISRSTLMCVSGIYLRACATCPMGRTGRRGCTR